MIIDFDLTPYDFRESYFEKQPHLQKAAVRGAAFAWSDLDEVLHRIEPVAPLFQLFKKGPVAEEQYTDRLVELGTPRLKLNKRRFYDQLRGGATLVVNKFESHSIRAMRLCTEVGRFCRSQTVGNAYLSLTGNGTFGKHWDTHDVFAIQLIGRKRWLVYPPTFPLPLDVHASDRSGAQCPPTPALDCVLEVGDLLYVPRGWWHHAIPFDEPSLHLSVGTYGPTIRDYVMWACARYVPGVLEARRSLTAAVDQSELEAVLQSLSEIVLDNARRTEFEREVASFERSTTEFDTELFFAAGAEGLQRGVTLTLASRSALNAERSEARVNGAWLRLHPISQSIVAALAVSSLPIEALYARLPQERPDAIRAAVLDLAQHEIVAIERAAAR